MQRTRQTDLLTIVLAYLGFIGIGMSAGLIGVAWPSMAAQFETSLDTVAYILTASTIGYLTASFFIGMLSHRLGVGRMLTAGAVLMVIGLSVTASASSLWAVVAVTLFGGFGSGMIDAGLNAYVAQHHSERAMNWLHAAFGVGVTISPLILGLLLKAGDSWRIGYGIVAGFMLVLAVLFLFTTRQWRSVVLQSEGQPSVERPSLIATLKKPVVLMGILMFVVYAGLEATPGQWVFTVFTKVRGIAEVPASQWVSIYWGSFTIGRIFFGAIINRVNSLVLVRVCMIGALIGALLLWLNPVEWVGFAGLTLLAFAQAPLFPVLISNTPKRIGANDAPNAIGFQVAGAGIGIAAIPALAGLIGERISFTLIPPFVVAVALLLIVLHELSIMQGNRIRAARVAAGD